MTTSTDPLLPVSEAAINRMKAQIALGQQRDRQGLGNDGVFAELSACVARFEACIAGSGDGLCSDCPPVNYSTDETRCAPCPRRAPSDNGQALSSPHAGLREAAMRFQEIACREPWAGNGGLHAAWVDEFNEASRLLTAALASQQPPQDEMREAATALVAKLDLLAPKIASDAAFMANRGFIYDGPTFGEELEALRAALTSQGGGHGKE